LSSAAFGFEVDENAQLPDARYLYESIPNLLGSLGEVQPIAGNTRSWNWVIQELKNYPLTFSQNVETAFIHKSLYREYPQAIQAVFGVCAAHACMNEANQPLLFQVIDSNISDLLDLHSNTSLLDDLAQLQAIVLYETIRLLYGGLEQRLVAEQQERAVQVQGLRLLQRANAELGAMQPTWQTWLVVENIRRTVMVAYMLYGVYSLFRLGICPELSTLGNLPVSTNPELWKCGTAFVPYQNVTMKYENFTASWVASPVRKLEPFEKMLLIACKGIEQVETFSSLAD
jgi:hypothetical protein